MTRRLTIWIAALCVPLSAADELADARRRIEQVRKAPLTVRVVDAEGEPLAGAKLRIEQLAGDVRFGCNLYVWGKAADQEQAYRDAFANLFDYATLPFYWWSYEPTPDAAGPPKRVHGMAAWCHERGITPKGHPLYWNRQDADWHPEDPNKLQRLALDRVGEVVDEFADEIRIWDAVNEASDFDRRGVGPKLTRMWREGGRIELTREAFKRARAADPDALLLINDYVTDERYETVIESLRRPDGSFPFDAIGIQSHMHSGEWPTEKIRDVCKRFGRFGLPLHFTELSILSGEHGWRRNEWPSTPEGERRQADHVERVYAELFADPNVAAITWWDLCDRWAWKQAPAGLLDKELRPKPAYRRLMRLIHDEWRTPTVETTVGADGQWRGRVFCGRYRVAASADDAELTAEFHVKRAPAENAQTLRIIAKRQE